MIYFYIKVYQNIESISESLRYANNIQCNISNSTR